MLRKLMLSWIAIATDELTWVRLGFCDSVVCNPQGVDELLLWDKMCPISVSVKTTKYVGRDANLCY